MHGVVAADLVLLDSLILTVIVAVRIPKGVNFQYLQVMAGHDVVSESLTDPLVLRYDAFLTAHLPILFGLVTFLLPLLSLSPVKESVSRAPN